MKVSGFSFIRNAVKYDYPIVEAISSILPLCDEFVIAIGNSDDTTEQLIRTIKSDKIKIINTIWNDSLRENGRVLADETDKAFNEISKDSDWAFYIQGDEVIHENSLDTIKNAMYKWKDDPEVDGLLLNYLHFYGSHHFVADSRKWYRKEIRVIKNDMNIKSYKDAQGFRKADNSKLRVKPVDATVFHYGWVKEPAKQQKKVEIFNKYWHNDEWIKKNISQKELYDYSNIDSLEKFTGTHPGVMKTRIEKEDWILPFDTSKKKMRLKDRLTFLIEKYSGWRIGEYKNYKIVKVKSDRDQEWFNPTRTFNYK
jgi:hypothetical protein